MHLKLATELDDHRKSAISGPTITGRHPEISIEDAYAIQTAGIRLRVDQGERIVGGKLGFTSKAMQIAMGVPSPNYGWLTDAMIRHEHVSLSELIHPKAEPEIAFQLGADLDENTTAEDVVAVTTAVAPSVEVVDSRFEDFIFAPNDNIADNSSAGQLVLGEFLPYEGQALDLLGVVVSVNGTVTATAAGAAALDHPAEAVAWMARAVAGSDRPLLKGDIVISGGLTTPIDLEPGMTVAAEFDRLGTCTFDVRN